MIYEIYTENGTKKKRALTGNGYGLPLGSIIAVYSNLVPDGYLPCNGAVYDTTTYAALYAYLGSNRLPDLRECGLVGAGQSSNDYDASTNPNGIHEHDVYEVGEFKDDQLQGHWHNIADNATADGGGTPRGALGSRGGSNDTIVRNPVTDGTNGTPRVGSTTHGKQVGVNYCIKATPAYVEPDTVSDMVNTLRTQDSYSTSEVNTGKTWINGKPIYRKVVDVGVVANQKHISHGITNANIILSQGQLYVNNATVPFPNISGNGYITYDVTQTEVIVYVSFSPSSTYAGIVIIEYTKTTD